MKRKIILKKGKQMETFFASPKDDRKRLPPRGKQHLFTHMKEEMKGWQYFMTHYNGGCPYVVYLDHKIQQMRIYTLPPHTFIRDHVQDIDRRFYTYLLLSFSFLHCWIGKSPKNQMTQFSGAYGRKYLGNSLLFLLSTKKKGPVDSTWKYIFIGDSIVSFCTQAPIVSYFSAVGNNDIPYPYAVDEKGYIYLLIENVMLHLHINHKKEEPYQHYYNMTNKEKKKWSSPIPSYHVLHVPLDYWE